jgi:hypothetical protein
MGTLSRAEAARAALRWVTGAAVPVPGGLAWPETRQPDGRISDDLYDGTAGVLMALAQARLAGLVGPDNPVSAITDLIMGEAGVLLALATMDAGPPAARAAGWIADRLRASARWPDGEPGGPEWLMDDSYQTVQPGFSHGAAGIAGFLLRLDRLHRDGPAAPRLWWPDRPPPAPAPV